MEDDQLIRGRARKHLPKQNHSLGFHGGGGEIPKYKTNGTPASATIRNAFSHHRRNLSDDTSAHQTLTKARLANCAVMARALGARQKNLVSHFDFGSSLFWDLVQYHPLGWVSLDGLIYWIPYGG